MKNNKVEAPELEADEFGARSNSGALSRLVSEQQEIIRSLRQQIDCLKNASFENLRARARLDESLAQANARLAEIARDCQAAVEERAKLEGRFARQADFIRRLEMRERRYRAALDETWAANQKLLAELQSVRGKSRFLKLVHLMLDALQAVTPRFIRKAVRPYYLRFYLAIFPSGASEFAPPRAPMLTVQSPLRTVEKPDEIQNFHQVLPLQANRALPRAAAVCPSYEPLVSVVLPVWNHAQFVAGSIRSVLNQTYRHLELIIVDDGSTDDLTIALAEFAGEPRVRVITQPHQGLSAALNTGFHEASGEFFTWTSADNLMKPEAVAELLDFLVLHPEIEMVYGNMELIDETGALLVGSNYRVSAQRPDATHELQLPRTVRTLGLVTDNFLGACFLYRARAARAAGDYDKALLGTEDYDYWLRIQAFGEICHVDSDRCLYSYRVHENTLSIRHPQIPWNTEELIHFHGRRLSYYKQPFQVVILYDGLPSFSETALATLAEAFQNQGQPVTLVAPRIPSRLIGLGISHVACRFEDLSALQASLKELVNAPKTLVLSLLTRPGIMDAIAESMVGRQCFLFQWLAPDEDPGRCGPLPPTQGWFLCGSARIQEALAPEDRRRSSLLIPSELAFSERLALASKARDNFPPLWDLSNAKDPLILCLVPPRAGLLDLELIARIIAVYPQYDFAFVSEAQPDGEVYDPKLPKAANLHWLGYKPFAGLYGYLARAAAVIAPFRNVPGSEGIIQDTMMSCLEAVKPVLATEAVEAAGFADMPGAIICAPEEFCAKLEDALEIKPDPQTAGLYLQARSPHRITENLRAIANSHLFFHRTRGSVGTGGSKPTSVLVETLTLDHGGLERAVADMVLFLKKDGIRVAVAVVERDGRMARECEAAGAHVYRIHRDRAAYEQVLRLEDPDLVVTHYSAFGAFSAAALGIPVLSVVHSAYVWHTSEQEQAVRDADTCVTRYVAVSSFVRDYFACKYYINPTRIAVIPNGLNIERHEAGLAVSPAVTRRDLGLCENDYIFLQVASVSEAKAQAHSIAALHQLVRETPHARLLLVGQDFDPVYRAFLDRLVSELALEGRVLFCGESDRIGDYYRLADAFLLPSLLEGWSLAMTEAMFYGLPLILTRVGGAEDVLSSGDMGILVPRAYSDAVSLQVSDLQLLARDTSPANLPELIAAMRRFIEKPGAWSMRGKAGTAKVIESLSLSHTARSYLEAIRETLSVAPKI